jgi:predicted RNA-binding protein with RPS1 domain
MVVCGVVSNVLDFGAFIDIGVGNQLLLHRTDMIAKDGNTRVSDPLQCVELGQILTLVVKDKDAKSTHQKLTLSMKGVPEGKPANLSEQPDFEFKEEMSAPVEDAPEEKPVKPARKSTKRKATEEVQEDEPIPKRRKIAAKEGTKNAEQVEIEAELPKSSKTSRSKVKEVTEGSEEIKPKRSRIAVKKGEAPDVAPEEQKPKRGRKKAVEEEKVEKEKIEQEAAVEKPKRGRPKKSPVQ